MREGRIWREVQISAVAFFALVTAGCQTDRADIISSKTVELAGTSWQLVELVSSDDAIGTVRPSDPSRYQIQLGVDGAAILKLDCNRGTGPWSSVRAADGVSGVFNIGPAAMTRAMCPPGSLDTRIGRELQYIRSYTVKDGRLNLALMADGGLQVWERQQGEIK